ncbi:unnamed protein product [Hermetia illucens]|uniref:Uncharacterized protein n=1 Tax=Hermetia illucens TaxID=343691 RepID=A0A7R8YUQ7_HERIL|nr:unnamed protein product [Hermetia illucens]
MNRCVLLIILFIALLGFHLSSSKSVKQIYKPKDDLRDVILSVQKNTYSINELRGQMEHIMDEFDELRERIRERRPGYRRK